MNYPLFSTLILCCCALNISYAQDTFAPKTHSIGIGPMLGYDFSIHGASYGVGMIYEYRPLNKISFFSTLNYEVTVRGISKNVLLTMPEIWKHEVFSLNGGIRYYLLKNLYIAGSLGLAYEGSTLQKADGQKIGPDFKPALYRSLFAGYQIPLTNKDIIEIETGFSRTKTSNRGGMLARYKF
ncbi:hypothetical protein [Sphingobacterium sp.]|uniref:hypothetical protein n=1 Tax=Sphingobacterium sp. TaxID=341027 RepID=UPI0028B0359C|nr:hypothetical protein [Sphingobacterium sp.]